jgi:hypothetical protein
VHEAWGSSLAKHDSEMHQSAVNVTR